MGNSGWTNDAVTTLVIPTGATTGARIVIGQAVPAELVAHYAPVTVQGVILFYHASGAYEYIATLSTNFTAFGSVTAGLVVQELFEMTSAGNEAFMPFAIAGVNIPTDGTNGDLVVAGDLVTVSRAGISGLSSPGTTNSGTYADLPGGGFAFDFNKRYNATSIKIEFSQSFVNTVTANNRIDFGVQINGVDYDVAALNPNVINQHANAAATTIVAAGLARNTYTIKGRWKRGTGTGTASINTDDWTSIFAEEV